MAADAEADAAPNGADADPDGDVRLRLDRGGAKGHRRHDCDRDSRHGTHGVLLQ